MLFITRDIGITAHFCDRVAVIYNGEIMELAPREDFFFRPAHPYTIMLMAAFSYNQRLRQLWARPEPLPGADHRTHRLPLRRPLPAGPAALPHRPPRLARARPRPCRALPLSGVPLMPLLEVTELVKRFPIPGSRNVVQAVNGISFTLEPGETLGIVGESGSGKTTVGRCVLGLTDLSAAASPSTAPTC